MYRPPEFTGAFLREDKKQPITIPEDDFWAMVEAMNKPDLVLKHRPKEWWRVFLYIAYYMGLRRGEILGVTWEQILFDTLEVKVSAMTSKGRKDRMVPMAPELGQVLREWRDYQKKADLTSEVLPWPFDSYRRLYDDWHAIQSAAGIAEGENYVLKNCRSSCASDLIAAGVPTVVVKDFLGHATVATTEKYYINTKPALRSAAMARKVRVK